jgi:HK97 family phage portal protein
LFGIQPSIAGVSVTEFSALGVASVFCAVSLIADAIAKLPLSAVKTQGGVTQPVPSWLDSPGFNCTKFDLVKTVLAHLLLWGNSYLAHVYNSAGALMALQPMHPSAVTVTWDAAGNPTYRVSLRDGTVATFTDATMSHVKGLSMDGRLGLSPMALARNSVFGTSIAADRSASRLFGQGALMSAVVTPAGDAAMTPEEAQAVHDSLTVSMSGESNAGKIAVINSNLNIKQWSLSNEDAQWLQSRTFQVEEVARWFRIPAHMIGLSDKTSSWGSGVAEMNQMFAGLTLSPWTSNIEDQLSALLPRGQVAQFDYHDMLSPDPEAQVGLLIQQVDAGLLTPNEARQVLNRTPLPNGDVAKPSLVAPPAVHNEKG